MCNHKISSSFDNKYKERLKNTILTNKDYKTIIQKYDSPQTFFFIDPPYELSEADKTYGINSNISYENLKTVLNNLSGKFLLTLNDSISNRNIFKDFNIKTVSVIYSTMKGGHSLKKKELIIKNY